METPDQQQTSQEKNAGSNNRQSASRKRPLQDSYTDQPHLHSPDQIDQIEDNMNLETEIAELKKLVKKQSKKIRSLEKLASKWVDWYLNCCYNSGISTQRG
jgi:RNA polymerase-binding transcription factor DksA